MTKVRRITIVVSIVGLALSVLFLLQGCQSNLQPPKQFSQGDYLPVWNYLEQRISREMEKHDVKGLSIALVDRNGVLWSKGFGMADSEKKIPANADTPYRIGSVTKPLTALVILRLHEKGLLNIDDPLKKYLPEFSIHNRFNDHNPITLRALLSHHSGLPSDRLAGMWVDAPASLEELVRQIRDESMASLPDTQYRYSNLGYSLLGRIIEIVTHKSYADAIQEELFSALEMRASIVSHGSDGLSNLSSGYRFNEPYPILPLRDLSAGGITSTVNDLAKVVTMLMDSDNRYLRRHTVAEVFHSQYPDLPLDFGHKVGFDWQLNGLNLPGGEHVAWHNGTAYPHQAHVALLPDYGLAVIILSNTMEASRFITNLGQDSLALLLAAQRGEEPILKDDTPENQETVEVPTNKLMKYAGHYNVLGQLTEFKLVSKHLETSLWGRSIEMLPIASDTFILQAKALGVIRFPLNHLRLQFKHVEDYDVAILQGITAPLVFTRIPKTPVPKAWQNRLGVYQVNTPGEAFQIQRLELNIENGLLVADTTILDRLAGRGETQIKMPFVAVSDDIAVMWGVANGEGGTLRYLGQDMLLYSGFQLKRILDVGMHH